MNTILKFGIVLGVAMMSSAAYSQEPVKRSNEPVSVGPRKTKPTTAPTKTNTSAKRKATPVQVKTLPAKKMEAIPAEKN